MSQLVKTKRQANFKDFKRFGAFKGLVEQKNVVFNSFVCKLGLSFGTRGPLKRSFYSRFKMAHGCQKKPNLQTNSSNKLLLMVFGKKVFGNTMRSKIKKIQRSVSNTLQLATRKNVIQMSSDVITMENCHY
jgi:hypothetical protein